jgi:hypothetical protein
MGRFQYELRLASMDQITIQKPNLTCRLYWSLLEFIDTVSHVGIFDPSCELAPL